MLTGFKNVKYGLQPGAKAKAPLQKPALQAFADDDDDNGGDEGPAVGRAIARQAAKKASDKKVGTAGVPTCIPKLRACLDQQRSVPIPIVKRQNAG